MKEVLNNLELGSSLNLIANGKGNSNSFKMHSLPLTLEFELPKELEASEPPEARGLARDEVNLMVSYRSNNEIIHSQFRELPHFLNEGDVVVINTSGTLNAAVRAKRSDGTNLELHLSTHLPADLWVVELRLPSGNSTIPFSDGVAGETLSLPGGAYVTLHVPYQLDRTIPTSLPARLWIATLQLPKALNPYLDRYGFPIRYSYVNAEWPNSYYQTVYATEKGSAEMPSAGRAFTTELITKLVAKGVLVVPILLHTGVASLESHEPPYEEYYRVSEDAARIINVARSAGKRIVAVGTTVIRALETVTDRDGVTHPGEGLTRLVITPARRIRSVTGLLTGFHEPRATHLLMLETLASREHLQLTYREALSKKYLWHEFGDLHLILP